MSSENIFQKNQFETWVGVCEGRDDFDFQCDPYGERAKTLYLDVLGEFSTHNRYYKIYRAIVERAKRRASSKKAANLIVGYSEKHHIFPNCMGNESTKKDRRNYVYLSAREHYVCHWLLTKFTTGESKYKLICGFWRMCNLNGLQSRQPSRYVEKAKRLHSNANSERFSGNNIRKKPLTEENRAAMRIEGKKLAEYMKNNPDVRAKKAKEQSERMKGVMPHENSLKNLINKGAHLLGQKKATDNRKAFGTLDIKIETPECCFFTYQQAADFYGIAPNNIKVRLERKKPPEGWRYVR